MPVSLKESIAIGAVLAWAVLLSVVRLIRQPEFLATASFLFGDEGVSMLVADTINGQGRLYQDVAFPYGALPSYVHAGFALWFGNFIATYFAYLLTFSLLHLSLLYALVRRFQPRIVASLLCVVVFTPTTLIPGALIGAYTTAAYITVERCLLVLAALLYIGPKRRSFGRAALLGLSLGMMQFTKFGGCVFVGGALIILDLLLIRSEGNRRDDYLRWLRLSLTTLAVFIGVEFVRIGAAFALLPSEIAWDVVWPAFAGRHYTSGPLALKRPGWGGAKYFLGQQLTPLVGLIFAFISLLRLIASSPGVVSEPERHQRDDAALLLLPLFYGLGTLAYFGHVHLYIQYAWCLTLGIAYLLPRLAVSGRRITAILVLPCALMLVKSVFFSPTPTDLEPLRLPNGETIYANAATAEAVRGIQSECARLRLDDEAGRREKLLIIPQGAGYHYFFKQPRFSRHAWYIPHYVRPYDGSSLITALDSTLAVVILNKDKSVDVTQAVERPMLFSHEVAQAILTRLGTPAAAGPESLVAPVRDPPQ